MSDLSTREQIRADAIGRVAESLAAGEGRADHIVSRHWCMAEAAVDALGDLLPTGVVYVVTSGEYSDYRVDGVYNTIEAAQKAAGSPIRHPRCSDTSIDEWVLGTVDRPSGEVEWHTGREGVTLSQYVHRRNVTIVNGVEYAPLVRSGITERPYYFNAGEPDIWVEQGRAVVTVYAVDREHGLKVLHDRMAEIVAREEGIA